MLPVHPLPQVASAAVCLLLALVPRSSEAQPCQSRTDGDGKECFVSLRGNDANPGTIARPFRTIAKGVSVVQAGDVLSLRGGTYVESLKMAGKLGTMSRPIVIRSYPGEQAFIDASLPQFRKLNNDDWERVQNDSDEYVSRVPVTGFVRGVFLDRQPYTRLITYSTLEDLRAQNQTFDSLLAADPQRPGPEVVDCDDDGKNCAPASHGHPWVYMGPGIWVDRTVSAANPQPVHIRLSPTHNNVAGVVDYSGEVDPRQLRIAIATEPMQALRITDSSYLRIERLDVRFGGDVTAFIRNTTGVVFDHVRFSASTYGVRTHQNENLTFQHCDFNGGKPSWYFRNDGKTHYWFLPNDHDDAVLNNLGQHTMGSLFVPSRLDTGTTIRNCEFHDGHDLYLGGSHVDFHHNWIRDLNDEGLFLDAYGREDVRIHDNVILKTLSAFSFASQAVGSQDVVGGPFFIYGNLVDLREPTVGRRPRYAGDTEIWRYGRVVKSNGEDGPYALVQNTFLVHAAARESDATLPSEQAFYLHYRNLHGSNLRRAFNNIFIAVSLDPVSDIPITIVPSPLFPAQTDGNLYQRIGPSTTPLYRYLPYSSDQQSSQGGYFDCLAECPSALIGSPLFEQSKAQYAPGYEAHSIEGDPQFQRIGADGKFRKTDDLRLRSTSVAVAAGMALHDVLLPDDPPVTGAQIGCYPAGSDPIHVGIEGRRSYPATP